MKKIASVKELNSIFKEVGEGEPLDFFMCLSGGIRSSKSICLIDEKDMVYSVINEVDDSEIELSDKDFYNSEITNIGKAMQKGAFYQY